MNKIKQIVDKNHNISGAKGAIVFDSNGFLGSFGVAKEQDLDEIKQFKTNDDGFNVLELNGFRVMVYKEEDKYIAVYTDLKE